jgi:hypothetical protein
VRIQTQPTQECLLCGNVEVVRPDGRGFPPDIAKRRLQRRCKAQGCLCDPKYTAGIAMYIQDQLPFPDDDS